MQKIKEITTLTGEDVKQFNKELSSIIRSDDKNLNKILDYVFTSKGKQIRVHMVFLSARLFGEVNYNTTLSAVLVQLLHTSTLMHDDVIDVAELRRGKKTVNSVWKNKIAILTGDYLLSKSISIATEHKIYEILNILTPTVSEMSIGEIIQMEETGNTKISEETYYNIIHRKTAVLIGASAEAGALSAGASKKDQISMKKTGQEAGMAFQIKDDILDLKSDSVFGKSQGKDLEEKKYTLPLIHALKQAPYQDGKEMIKKIDKGVNKKDIADIRNFIEHYDGFEYAEEKMQERTQNALDNLKDIPDSEAKRTMNELIMYFSKRNK